MTPADKDAVFKLLVQRLGEADNWTMPPASWWRQTPSLLDELKMKWWNALTREEKIAAWILATDEDYEQVVDQLLNWYERQAQEGDTE
jgi:hypothetical protein